MAWRELCCIEPKRQKQIVKICWLLLLTGCALLLLKPVIGRCLDVLSSQATAMLPRTPPVHSYCPMSVCYYAVQPGATVLEPVPVPALLQLLQPQPHFEQTTRVISFPCISSSC